jgi:hypothetical protein
MGDAMDPGDDAPGDGGRHVKTKTVPPKGGPMTTLGKVQLAALWVFGFLTGLSFWMIVEIFRREGSAVGLILPMVGIATGIAFGGFLIRTLVHRLQKLAAKK